METTSTDSNKTFDYTDAKKNISTVLTYLSTYISRMNIINDGISDSSTDSYINSLLHNANDITEWTEILKYNIKTLSNYIGK